MRFHGHVGRGRSLAAVCIALPRDEVGQEKRLRPPIFHLPPSCSRPRQMWRFSTDTESTVSQVTADRGTALPSHTADSTVHTMVHTRLSATADLAAVRRAGVLSTSLSLPLTLASTPGVLTH
jgi:hypothetical protein